MRRIWIYGLALALTGWVSPGQAQNGAGTYTYTDVLKPHGHARGEAEEQAATLICDGGDSYYIGLPAFNACMRARGWRLTGFEAAPAGWRDADTGLWCHHSTFLGVPAAVCSNY